MIMVLDLDNRSRSTIKIKIEDQDLLSRSKTMIIDHDQQVDFFKNRLASVFFGRFWSFLAGFGRFKKARPNGQTDQNRLFGRCIQAALALSGVIQDVYTFCDFNQPPPCGCKFKLNLKLNFSILAGFGLKSLRQSPKIKITPLSAGSSLRRVFRRQNRANPRLGSFFSALSEGEMRGSEARLLRSLFRSQR